MIANERKRELFLQMYRENCIKENANRDYPGVAQNYQQRGYAYEDIAILFDVDYGTLVNIRDSVNQNDWQEYMGEQGEIIYRPAYEE